MSDIVIRAENLGKSYMIGHEKHESYTALRDVIIKKSKQIAIKTRQMLRGGQLIAGTQMEEFWALKEINFEINQGDSVGIIGRNGAGKSTLLKVLSRITEPSTGRLMIRGRMASLLEVGTGFHPELSGRENIYLNGAIMGMTRKEIKSKFDEIVDFSGIEKFLDTPVKRYSSGMYVRLAFSVAAHLESEILIIDEVLAVGDAEFQKKCLGKMSEVSRGEGRTVLFVSHNMAAIENLCNSGILLRNGVIHSIADTKTVISNYLSLNSDYSLTKDISSNKERKGNGIIKFEKIVLIDDASSEEVSEIKCGADIRFRIFLKSEKTGLKDILLSIGINDQYEQRISFISNEMVNQKLDVSNDCNFYIDLIINKLPFTPGRYNLTLFCSIKGEIADWIQNAFYFNVCAGDFYSTGRELPQGQGNFLLQYSYNVKSN